MRSILALTLAAVAVSFAQADETPIKLDQLPKAVKEAVTKRFPKATLVEAAKEVEDGKTSYEVSIKDGETKMDVTFTEAGVLTGIEKIIDAKDLPKAVPDALGTKYPKATYKTVEEVTKVKDGKEYVAYYEVLLVTTEKKTFEVEVLADGTVKNIEEKKDAPKPEKN